MAKVDILMPVYNDQTYLEEAISSVLSQKDVDLRLIIVDDGSTDSTQDIIKKFGNEEILYIRHSTNNGQLEALLTAADYVEADYVALFHGDDRLLDNRCIHDYVDICERENVDGIYSDLVTMNSKGEIIGKIKARRNVSDRTLIHLLANAGGNPIPDPFFVTRSFFFNFVVENYIKWNMPYWFYVTEESFKVGNIKYVNRPWYVYRLSEENYVRSEIGKFVSANGVFRTIVTLSKFIHLPNFYFLDSRLKRRLWRVTAKLTKLSVSSEKYRRQVLELLKTVRKAYGFERDENEYYKAIFSFYESKRIENPRVLYIKDISNTHVYLGKDVNLFYKDLKAKKLPDIYRYLLEEAQKGYFEVVTCVEDVEILNTVLRFLNIATMVRTQR
ncbi:glycosyltransferase family 2 protein [Fervidobacterium sp.]